MPRKSNKVYVIGRVAFVPHPMFPGFWIKTDLSVVKVACSYPECGSAVGVPCRKLSPRARRQEEVSYGGETHWYRRRDAKGKGRAWKDLRMIIVGGTP